MSRVFSNPITWLVAVCAAITTLVAVLLQQWVGIPGGIAAGLLVCVGVWLILEFKTQPQGVSEIEAAFDELVATQTVPVACPCGKGVFSTPIFLNQDNVFECKSCNSKFKVELTYESILITEPLSLINVFESLKEKEKELSYNDSSNENG